MINIPYKESPRAYNQLHPGMQFLIFIGVFIGVLIICNLIGIGIVTALYGYKNLLAAASLKASTPNFVTILWILQLIGTTLPIFVTPVFFANIIVNDAQDYIKPTFRFHWGLLLLVLGVMAFSNPCIELLSNINSKMKLPPSLKGLEDWMKDSEKSAEDATDAMLQMKTVWSLICDVFLIGLVTAIVEEFMFRGVLQTIFVRWTKSIHAAVWITAILFSAFHMEFYGFLPRLLLGLLFGYFVAWSGSVWPAVWGHFLNNGADVVITYLFQHKIIKTDPNDQHVFNYVSYTVSILIILALMFIYRKVALVKLQSRQSDGEELD
jgi:membrane protease YdiL (CAAX protease family)